MDGSRLKTTTQKKTDRNPGRRRLNDRFACKEEVVGLLSGRQVKTPHAKTCLDMKDAVVEEEEKLRKKMNGGKDVRHLMERIPIQPICKQIERQWCVKRSGPEASRRSIK